MAFCEALGTFTTPNYMMIMEAPLNVTDKKLPYGNIDIVIVTPGTDTITTSNIGVMILDGESRQVKLATSMKSEHTKYYQYQVSVKI